MTMGAGAGVGESDGEGWSEAETGGNRWRQVETSGESWRGQGSHTRSPPLSYVPGPPRRPRRPPGALPEGRIGESMTDASLPFHARPPPTHTPTHPPFAVLPSPCGPGGWGWVGGWGLRAVGRACWCCVRGRRGGGGCRGPRRRRRPSRRGASCASSAGRATRTPPRASGAPAPAARPELISIVSITRTRVPAYKHARARARAHAHTHTHTRVRTHLRNDQSVARVAPARHTHVGPEPAAAPAFRPPARPPSQALTAGFGPKRDMLPAGRRRRTDARVHGSRLGHDRTRISDSDMPTRPLFSVSGLRRKWPGTGRM